MRQLYLIQKAIDLIGLDGDIAGRPIPAILPLLQKDVEGMEHNQKWSYRSAVGMVIYLQETTKPDISMTVHQSACFNNNQMLSHENAITRIVRYQLASKDCGVVSNPNKKKEWNIYEC